MCDLRLPLLVLIVFSLGSVSRAEDELIDGEDEFIDTGDRSGRWFKFGDLFSSKDEDIISCHDGSDYGVCQSSMSCRSKKGKSLGKGDCETGSCCQYEAKCPTRVTEPCIIKQSGATIMREKPDKFERTYVFPKLKGVYQVRLDLDQFSLFPPNDLSECMTDAMTVIGSSTVGDLTICGENSRQHMYLTYSSQRSINITMKVNRAESRYMIRATYIKERSNRRVPSYCLQNFKSLEGRVISFGNNTRQLNNQEYTVCVDRMENFNRIEWRPCEQPIWGPFFVSGTYPGQGEPYPRKCTTDWVDINGYNKICGSAFPVGNVIVDALPFIMSVHFDAEEIPALTIFPLGPTGNPCDAGGPPACDPALGPKAGEFCCDLLEGFCTCQVDALNPPGGALKFDTFNTGFCLEYIQRR